MIVEIVKFERPQGFSDEDLLQDGRSTIPRWQGYPGLVRKQFVTDGPVVLGIYTWVDRAAAAKGHDAAWVAAFEARTGTKPQITQYDLFLEIDNTADSVAEHIIAVD
jgi:hypothetical protein